MYKFNYSYGNGHPDAQSINHVVPGNIKTDTYYKLATDSSSIEAKRIIKNVLIDSFYELVTKKEDSDMMDILYASNNELGNRVTIAIKGGGALRIYNDEFMQSIIPVQKAQIDYTEKISDIDVNLESHEPIDYMKVYAVRMLQWIRNNKSAELLAIVNDKMAAMNGKMTAEFNNPVNQNAYKPHLQRLYGGGKVVTGFQFQNIAYADKKFDTMLVRNDTTSYIIFTRSLLSNSGVMKPDTSIDITFNDDLALCKASISSFSLARFRVCINMNFVITYDDLTQSNIAFPGCIELYDLGISNSNKDSTIFNTTGDYLDSHEMVKHKIGAHEYSVYSLMYNIHDLINVIYSQSIFPWDDKKYAKRINRILHYCTVYDLTCKSLAHVKENVNLVTAIFDKVAKAVVDTQQDYKLNYKNCIMNLFLTHKTLAYRGSSFQYFVEEHIQIFIMLVFVTGNMTDREHSNYAAYLKHIIGPNKCTGSSILAGDLNKITGNKLESMNLDTYGIKPAVYDGLRRLMNDKLITYLQDVNRLLANAGGDPGTESLLAFLNKLNP